MSQSQQHTIDTHSRVNRSNKVVPEPRQKVRQRIQRHEQESEANTTKAEPLLNRLQSQPNLPRPSLPVADHSTLRPTATLGASTLTIQPKMQVNEPNDPFEVEAERMADQVMRMPSSDLSAWGRNAPTEPMLQLTPLVMRSEEAIAPTITPEIEQNIQRLQNGGQPLADDTRAFFEQRMGADFSNVRIHTDANAIQTSRDIHARAFTVGNNIAFNSGEYNPDSSAGKYLLAHELTHTMQQGAAGELQRESDAGVCPTCDAKGVVGEPCAGCGETFVETQTVMRQALSAEDDEAVAAEIIPPITDQATIDATPELAQSVVKDQLPQEQILADEIAADQRKEEVTQTAEVPNPIAEAPEQPTKEASALPATQADPPIQEQVEPPVNEQVESEPVSQEPTLHSDQPPTADATPPAGDVISLESQTAEQAPIAETELPDVETQPLPQVDRPTEAAEPDIPADPTQQLAGKAAELATQTTSVESATPPISEAFANNTAQAASGAPDFASLPIPEALATLKQAETQTAVAKPATPPPPPAQEPAIMTEAPTAEVAPPTIEPLPNEGAQTALEAFPANDLLTPLRERETLAFSATPLDVLVPAQAAQPLPLAAAVNHTPLPELPEIAPREIATPDQSQPEQREQQPLAPVENAPATETVAPVEKAPIPKDEPLAELPPPVAAERPPIGETATQVEALLDEQAPATVQRMPTIQRNPLDALIPDWVEGALDSLRGDASAKESSVDADGTTTKESVEADATAQGSVIEADGQTKSGEVDADGESNGTELVADEEARSAELETDQQTQVTAVETARDEQSDLLTTGQEEQATQLDTAQQTQDTELTSAEAEQGEQLDTAQQEQDSDLETAQTEQGAELDTAQQEQGQLLDEAQAEQAAQLEADRVAQGEALQTDVNERDAALQADAESQYGQLEVDAAEKSAELDSEAANKQVEMQGQLDTVGSEATVKEQEITQYVTGETTTLTTEATAANTQLETDWTQVQANADGVIERLDAEAGAICAENQQSADNFLASLDPFIEDAQAGWETIKQAATERWNDFIERAREELGWLDDALSAFNQVASQVWDTIKTKATELALQAGMMIADAIVWATQAWQELSALWNDTEAYLQERAQQARDWIADKAEAARQWVADKAEAAREWVAQQAEAANAWIGEKAEGARDWISEQAEAARAFIGEKAEAVRTFIATKAEEARALIGTAAETARTFIGDKADAARTFIGDKQTAANEWIGGQADTARTFIGDKQTAANDWITGKADAANDWIADKQTAATTWIGDRTADAQAWIDGRADQISETFRTAGQGLVTGLTGRAREAVNAISSQGGPIMQFFGGIVNSLISGVERIGTSVVDVASNALSWGLGQVETLASGAVQLVGTAATGAVNFVGDNAATAVSAVATTATTAVNFVGDTATGAVNFVETGATGAVNFVAETGTGVVNFVEEKATGAVNFVEEKATGAVNWVEDKATTVVNTTEGWVVGAVDTVEGAATGAVTQVEGLATGAVDYVADKATGAVSWLEGTATGVIDAAENKGTQAVNLIEQYGPVVIDAAKAAWEVAKEAFWQSNLGQSIQALNWLTPKISQGVDWLNNTIVQPATEWVSAQIDEAKQWVQEQFPGLVACWNLFQSFMSGIDERLRQLPVIGDFMRAHEAIQNALNDIVEGALLGDLIDDPNGWNILGQVLIGFVPYAGQVADIRDLLATLDKMGRGEAGYLDLSLALVAFIPGFGDAAKAGRHLDNADEALDALDEIAAGLDEAADALDGQLDEIIDGGDELVDDVVEGTGGVVKSGDEVADLDPDIFNPDGTFKDADFEAQYQSYVERRTQAGEPYKDRVDYKETRDPFIDGRAFDEAQAANYPHNQVYVYKDPSDPSQGYYIVDSYNPGAEIVSRKNTQLGNIQESTAIDYLNELNDKYPPGATIGNVPSSGDLAGKTLDGELVLEVPVQTQPIPQAVINKADELGITIRGIDGTVYNP